MAGYKKFLFGRAEGLRRVSRVAVVYCLSNSKRHLRQGVAQIPADRAFFRAALNDYLFGLEKFHVDCTSASSHYSCARARSEPRRERAHERKGPLTCRVLGYKLAFFPRTTLHHLDVQASSRYRPIARDRRGLLLGGCPPWIVRARGSPFGRSSPIVRSKNQRFLSPAPYPLRRQVWRSVFLIPLGMPR
jgi:hypothetical protein